MVEFYPRITLGCDPEFFFEEDGEIVGSERVMPKEGLGGIPIYDPLTGAALQRPGVVLDGVQGEFNPAPAACRAQLGNSLRAGFLAIKAHLTAQKKGIKLSSRAVIDISEKELSRLSDASKLLGCAPSLNVYDPKASINVDASKFRTRSAGGHIHLGTKACGKGQLGISPDQVTWGTACNIPQLVEIMDIIVGNTCVLLDRGDDQRKRREVYGRAGEYREQPHGMEYRTLSNFWLRSYPVASLVWGLARQASAVAWTEWIAQQPVYVPPTDEQILKDFPEATPARGNHVAYDPIKGDYREYKAGEMIPTGHDAKWRKAYRNNLIAANSPKFTPDGEATKKLLSRFDREKVTAAINMNDPDLAYANWRILRKWVEDEVKPIDPEKFGASYTPTGDYANWTLDPPYLDDVEYFIEKGLDYWFPLDPLTWWTQEMPVNGHRVGWEAFLATTVRKERGKSIKHPEQV